jgi:hypothetical protein
VHLAVEVVHILLGPSHREVTIMTDYVIIPCNVRQGQREHSLRQYALRSPCEFVVDLRCLQITIRSAYEAIRRH